MGRIRGEERNGPSFEEERWKRREKRMERGCESTQGSNQKRILLPHPRESLVTCPKRGKAWEMPFQMLLCEEEGKWSAF